MNRLKPVRCDNCWFWQQNKNYTEGVCQKDNRPTREHWVCDKLPTDNDRRYAKLRRNG